MNGGGDVRVDISALERFSERVRDSAVDRMRPRAEVSVRVIEAGADAVGADARFLEAARVRRRGDVTTASAQAFLGLLGSHVESLSHDARRAGRVYQRLDDDAAERVNVARARLGQRKLRNPENECYIFAPGRNSPPRAV